MWHWKGRKIALEGTPYGLGRDGILHDKYSVSQSKKGTVGTGRDCICYFIAFEQDSL